MKVQNVFKTVTPEGHTIYYPYGMPKPKTVGFREVLNNAAREFAEKLRKGK